MQKLVTQMFLLLLRVFIWILMIGYISGCTVNGVVGDGTAQGDCEHNQLCQSSGKCTGTTFFPSIYFNPKTLILQNGINVLYMFFKILYRK